MLPTAVAKVHTLGGTTISAGAPHVRLQLGLGVLMLITHSVFLACFLQLACSGPPSSLAPLWG